MAGCDNGRRLGLLGRFHPRPMTRPPPPTRLNVIAIIIMTVLVAAYVYACTDMAVGKAEAHGDAPADIDTLLHAASTYRSVSYWTMYTIARCESGQWDRRVIDGRKLGKQRERGIVQIHPRGLGPLFESRTGDYSPSDSLYFLAWAITQGMRGHWSC
jgi:hypothetical protein